MSTESYRWHYDYTRILWDAGFCFNNQKSLKAFDRNGIALLDIERIIRDRDIGIVEHHIQNILEYTLDSEEARILDPNFVKLFRLSQLAVEYLHYCKKYLDATTDTLKKELQKANEENDDLKQDIINYELEVSKLKKKIKDLKSTLHVHQKYPVGTIYDPVGTFRCNTCRKGFLNAEYLKKHFLKRHPDSNEIHILETKENLEPNSEISTPVHTQYKAETDKLQMEIKELKEKLNNTERFFQNKTETVPTPEQPKDNNDELKSHSEEYYKHVEELHHQFELLKSQIESEMHFMKSQKIEQDKYEELMEKFFHKLDERKEKDIETIQPQETAQINKPRELKIVEKIIVVERPVQTDEEISNEGPEEIVQVEPTKTEEINKPSEEKIIPPTPVIQNTTETISESPVQEPVDVEKLKEAVEKDLEEKSKQNIEKLGQQISENIANTFDILQTRLETFWNKLQEIEVDRVRQQQIQISKSPSKSESSTKKDDGIIRVQEIIQVKEKYIALSQSSDDDSETESSKNEKLIRKPQSVLKTVQKNDKIARNLMEELKTKVEERNSSMVIQPKREKSPEKPSKPILVEKPQKPVLGERLQKSVLGERLQKPVLVERQQKPVLVERQQKPVLVERQQKPVLVDKPTVQQIYSKVLKSESSSEEESETETEESESESETESPVIVKPSKTTSSKSQQATLGITDGARSSHTGISTLQNRSITSLETALRANPQILIQLREDMKDVVASRLKDLGIDPEWSRIPDKTYKQNSEIVTHHRNMAAKNVKSFMDIRNDILENLEEQVKDLKRRESRDLTTPEPEQKQSRFKSLFKNMRNKAKLIMKPERSSTPTAPIYKLTMHKHHSSPNIKQSPEISQEIMKSKSASPKTIKTTKSVSEPSMYDSDSETETNEYHPKTPIKSIKTKTVQSTKKGLRKSRSESSMEVVEFSDQGSEIPKMNSVQNLARSFDSILEMKKELASQLKKSDEKIYFASSTDTLDNAKDEVMAVSPREKSSNESRDKNLIQKAIETERGKLDISSSDIESDELKDDERIQKSVLKNMASTSAVKKKVLFDLHSENTKTSETTEEQKSGETKTPVKKTIVKPNSVFKTNDWGDSSTSLDSSILDLKKGTKQLLKGQGDTISTKALINVSTKQNKAQDDVSDWEISDIN